MILPRCQKPPATPSVAVQSTGIDVVRSIADFLRPDTLVLGYGRSEDAGSRLGPPHPDRPAKGEPHQTGGSSDLGAGKGVLFLLRQFRACARQATLPQPWLRQSPAPSRSLIGVKAAARRPCANAPGEIHAMIVTVLAALAEPTHLCAMRLLADGSEHCVCELIQLPGVTQSRMSRHMQVLKQAGRVVDRRDAPWVRYRLNPPMPVATHRPIDAACAPETLAKEGRAA